MQGLRCRLLLLPSPPVPKEPKPQSPKEPLRRLGLSKIATAYILPQAYQAFSHILILKDFPVQSLIYPMRTMVIRACTSVQFALVCPTEFEFLRDR